MAYSYKAITTVWLAMLILFAASASRSVTGPWGLLLAAAAFVAPMSLTLWPKRGTEAAGARARV